GILNQCIHDGFGLQRFKEALTGPEYAQRDIEGLQTALESDRISVLTSTFVTTLNQDTADTDAEASCQSPSRSSSSPPLRNPLLRLKLVSKGSSRTIHSRSVVLAMGCRERTAGAISLPGTRPAGVFTAGAAQRMMNMQNVFVGKRVMIIGSGDIGLIMARRLSLEGSSVAGVSEIMPFAGGLERNIRQCLHDFSIPLYLHTRAEKIHGKDRVEGVTIRSLDDRDLDVRGNSELYIPCDTVLLSVGLIPENELSRGAGARLSPVTGGPDVDGSFMTSVPGLFACGNVLQVHDVVDYVSEEAFSAGNSAAAWAELSRTEGTPQPQKDIRIRKFSHLSEADTQDIIHGSEIRYVVPQRFLVPPAGQDRSSEGKTRNESSKKESIVLSFRVAAPSGTSIIRVHQAGKQILRRKRVRVHPSEMIRLQVTPLPGIHAPLEVSCEQQ
ncbi:MAG: NAD(P)/FAD-dependent oxidoreductase, partial [Spirochaetia bacterium]|nr:NAD(P)/FAD-dependent oxidoreductase [Spirochaetia bacterium]